MRGCTVAQMERQAWVAVLKLEGGRGGSGVSGGWWVAVDTEAGCLWQCDLDGLKGGTGTNENNAQ